MNMDYLLNSKKHYESRINLWEQNLLILTRVKYYSEARELMAKMNLKLLKMNKKPKKDIIIKEFKRKVKMKIIQNKRLNGNGKKHIGFWF